MVMNTTHTLKIKFILVSCLLILVVTFFSCSKYEEPFQTQYLEEYSEISNITYPQILSLLGQSNIFPSEASLFVKYGVKAVKIDYKTIDLNNQSITASGLLLIPETQYQVPILSFQHGTIFSDTEAPSNYQSDFTDMLTIMASTGYAILVPDYLGYGSSSHIAHPYEHRSSLATACRDMIRAGYEYFIVSPESNLSNKLFLAGYSEGGFATMSLFKLLQEENNSELPVAGVSIGAGAYNKTLFAKWITAQNSSSSFINYFLWVMLTYNSIYDNLQRPISHYINSPWAEQVLSYGPLAQVESNPSVLFQTTFVESIANETDIAFQAALAHNDCFDWKPLSPLLMIHGNADELVPFFNSQTAFDAMIAQGSNNVSLTEVNGGTHESVIAKFAMDTFWFFEGLKTGTPMQFTSNGNY
jgi:pimeloyl-ACP methyl ester carboxylesterase